MKALRYVNKYLWKYRFRLLFGTVCIIISNIFGTLQAPLVGKALKLVMLKIDEYKAADSDAAKLVIKEAFNHQLMIYGLTILGMALLSGVFLFLTRQTIIVMSRLFEYDIKNEIYEHYQALSLSFYRQNNTGDLMARISEDVGKVRMYMGPAIMYGLNLITSTILVISFMVSANPKLALITLLPLPFLSFSIYFVSKKIEKKSGALQKSLSQLSTFVQEAFSGIRVIKSFAREDSSIKNFSNKAIDYQAKSIALSSINAYFFPLIVSLIGLSTILIIYITGLDVISGNGTYGKVPEIAEFILYVNKLAWPVTAVGWVTSIIQRAEASQERINEFLKTKPDITSKNGLKKEINGGIEFKDINLTYQESGTVALKNVSFKIPHGTSLGIIGHTGSGKSTIANLLCRMYDPNKGQVLIDGIDLKTYDLQHVRSQLGYVPQDVFLFSDTIKRNIAFGMDSISEEKIMTAAKDADLYDNIQAFPEKFETILGERGITLSGGQKQRVSIARALVRDPKVMILDDSLSAVDTNTENIILENLKRIMAGRTSVIISHRVSSVKLADKIIVLEDGMVIEEGSHEELLEKNGVYRSVYDKQLQTEEN